MMHQMELSHETYDQLQKAAQTEGVSPEEWIQARLLSAAPQERPFQSVAEAIAPYTVDSRSHTPDPRYRSAFGNLVEEKLAQQGFKRPEWPR